MRKDLKVGDQVKIDASELGKCVVERIDGSYAFLRAEKATTYYECEPGDPTLYAFRKSQCEDNLA